MSQLFFLNIDYKSLDLTSAREAIRIARTNGVTYYDAVHVAVSLQHASALVTDDKELLKKFKNAIPMKDALEGIETAFML
ncbi:MAG: PIN domain-containing protein [Theionarchaea archaeon]|nr:PIN domain-containing protein [Theionarchaea archaeon]